MNYNIGDTISNFSEPLKYTGVIIGYSMRPYFKDSKVTNSLIKDYQPCYLVSLDDGGEIWYREEDIMVIKQAVNHAPL